MRAIACERTLDCSGKPLEWHRADDGLRGGIKHLISITICREVVRRADEHGRYAADAEVICETQIGVHLVDVTSAREDVAKGIGIEPYAASEILQHVDVRNIRVVFESRLEEGAIELRKPALFAREKSGLQRAAASNLAARRTHDEPTLGGHGQHAVTPVLTDVLTVRIGQRYRLGPQLVCVPSDAELRAELARRRLERGQLEVAVRSEVVAPEMNDAAHMRSDTRRAPQAE